MKVLTVSIAAYNVEDYLRKCLDSFVDESNPLMHSVEVIIVSDGSKDNTVSIAKEYESKYPDTFILIDKENGGYGSTINASLKEAKGKYFKLVDGDDWVNTSDFYSFVEFLDRTNADMVISKYCFVNDVDGTTRIPERGITFDGETHPFDDLGDEAAFEMHYLAFKTDILRNNGIVITEKCFYTDVEYMLKPIPYINTFAATNLVVYMYRIGREGQSVSISSWQKNIDMALKVTFVLADFYSHNSNSLSSIKRKYIFERVEGTAEGKYRIFLSFPPSSEIKKKMLEYDKALKIHNNKIYSACIKNIFVNILRKTNFTLYYPLSLAYRYHLKKTKQI